MGKAHLTLKDLNQFPTLRNLLDGSEGRSAEEWGMCRNADGDITFGETSADWTLLVSLDGLFECASLQCGEDYYLEDLILFYAAEYPLWEDIRFEFIILSEYEEKIKTNPQIDWSYTQC